MNYKKQLDIAKKENLNITKLFIANEVFALMDDKFTTLDETVFENICSIIYDNYLKIEYASINDIARIVCELFLEHNRIEEKTIRTILENDNF